MTDGPVDFAAVIVDDEDAPNAVIELFTRYAQRHPGLLAVAIVAQAGLIVFSLAPPYLLGLAVDLIATGPTAYDLPFVSPDRLPTSTRDLLYLTLGLLIVAAFLAALFHLINYFAWHWFHENAKHDVRVHAYESTHRLGLDFFATTQTGDVMSVVNNDVNQLDGLFHRWPASMLSLVNGLIALTLIMLYLHWQLALLTITVTLPAGIVTHLFSDRVEPRHADVRRLVGELNARIENSISGIATVKANTNEQFERRRVAESSREHRDVAWSVTKLNALFQPGMRMFTELSYVFVFLVGGWWAVFGLPIAGLEPLTVGVFVTFFFYAQQFAGRSAAIGSRVDQYYDLKASAMRVSGLMRHPVSIPETQGAEPLSSVDGNVTYEDVTFEYPGAVSPALRDVSFEIDEGSFVGIVGPTGAGKTTLLKLLVRFYDPDSGTIRVDGRDVRDVTVESLRNAIGYVSQEPFLFDDTVRDNIAYAERDATDAAVVRAAKQANAHEFILELEEGYDTRVGERGVKLSGGQRQRIAIARTLLEDPPILILDEATSHVDNRTELLIQESLATLIADRTTFAIAHGLSTVRDADQLLIFEDGQLVERGTHDELCIDEGLYAQLWSAHVGARAAVRVEEVAD